MLGPLYNQFLIASLKFDIKHRQKLYERECQDEGHLQYLDNYCYMQPGVLPVLDFHDQNTSHSTHALHPFAAKFPPQLACWAIEQYSQPGETVCDPMAGSGTTLVEAWRLGRSGIGFDIDPLACLIAQAKSTPIEVGLLSEHNRRLVREIETASECFRMNIETGVFPDGWLEVDGRPELPNLDYWFTPQVQVGLTLLKRAIRAFETQPAVKRLWYVVVSSLILAKNSVANARDIVHSRHHHFRHEQIPDPIDRFCRRLRQVERQMRAYSEGGTVPRRGYADIHCNDSRNIPLAAGSVDLIVMSPPYCNALDYTRAHRFAVAWLADVLAITFNEYVIRGRAYIGSERGQFGRGSEPVGIAEVDTISDEIGNIDPQRGRLVATYFQDMQSVLAEAGRILAPGGYAVVVVCPSNIRRIPITWHQAFAALANRLPRDQQMGEIAVIERTIYDNRRILPYMNAGTQLASRMRKEYVLVLRKPRVEG